MATQSPFSWIQDLVQNFKLPFTLPFALRLEPPLWLTQEVQRRIVLLVNHVLAQEPQAMERLAFYVLAPQQQLAKGKIEKAIDKTQISTGVHARVKDYGSETGEWYTEWFEPVLKKVTIEALAWEDVIAAIVSRDALAGQEIGAFYEHCLRFGPPVQRKAGMEATTSHQG